MTRKILIAAVLASMASACVSLLPEPPPPANIYRIEAGAIAPVAGLTKDVVIAVDRPQAPRSMAGANLVWRQDSQITFIERSVWDGAAPDLLAAALVDILQRSGAVKAATPSGAGVRANAEIIWDVSDFSVHGERRGGVAHFVVSAQLVDLVSRDVIDTLRIETTAPLSERSGRSAAAALEQAAREGMMQIASWAVGAAQPRAASTSK